MAFGSDCIGVLTLAATSCGPPQAWPKAACSGPQSILARPDAHAAAVQQAQAAIAERQAVDEAQRAVLIESVRTLQAESPPLLRQVTEAMPGISQGLAANVLRGVLAGFGWLPGAGG